MFKIIPRKLMYLLTVACNCAEYATSRNKLAFVTSSKSYSNFWSSKSTVSHLRCKLRMAHYFMTGVAVIICTSRRLSHSTLQCTTSKPEPLRPSHRFLDYLFSQFTLWARYARIKKTTMTRKRLHSMPSPTFDFWRTCLQFMVERLRNVVSR